MKGSYHSQLIENRLLDAILLKVDARATDDLVDDILVAITDRCIRHGASLLL